jgi:drug/metabolite transporter (DMT)-like permease
MATLLALISGLLWGSADFEGGRLSKKYPAIAVLGITQVIGLFTGLIIVIISQGWQAPSVTTASYFIPGMCAGISGFLGLICLYTGLSTGRMGVVSPISALSAIIPLGYAIYKGDRLSTITAIGIALALLGAFCASGPEINNGLPIKPLILALGAMLGFGVALVFMSIGSKTSALMTMTTMRATSVIFILLIAVRSRSIGNFSKMETPKLIFIGSADFLANLLLGIACNKGLVSVAMVLGSLYPIFTVLMAYKFLHERLHKVQYVGVALAVAGVALISAF